MNGNAAILERLIQAGADPNAPVSKTGDTALMMAARTGKLDATKVLLDHGAQVNAKETWGGTTALMWAVSERHPEVVQLLVEHAADVNAKSNFVPSASGRGFEGTAPVAPETRSKDRRICQRLDDARSCLRRGKTTSSPRAF